MVYIPPAPAHVRSCFAYFCHYGAAMDIAPPYSEVLSKLAEGCTFQQAAQAAGITRQAVWKMTKSSPHIRDAITEARRAGAGPRAYGIWRRHPFRGKRPPTGRGQGGKPRFFVA